MCKYLLPVTTPDPVQHLQPTLAQSKSFQPVLPSDLPLIDDFLVTQAKDPTLAIWFTWLKEQKPPPPEHPQYHWWISDKDAMFLNEVDLLCRFALISTSAAARKCSQVVVPTDFIPKVLHFVHGSDSFGHQGFSRSLFHLRAQFFWPNMRDQLLRHIQSCPCQGIKAPRAMPAMLSDSLLATNPNITVAVDCTGPLPISSSNNAYILVLQDLFTKYTELIPLPNIQAASVAAAILNVWILRYGPMKRLLSDNGTEFTNLTLKSICAALAIKKIFVSPIHPQGNGQVERLMSTIKRLIASQSTIYPLAWDCYLPRLQYIYNCSIHKATNESPYFLWFARVPPALQQLTETLLEPDLALPVTLDQFKKQLIHHLISTTYEVAVYTMQHRPAPAEPQLQTTFETGDLVWLEDKTQVQKTSAPKLTNFWTGPFLVLEVFANRNVRILRPTPVSPRQEIKISDCFYESI